MFYERCIYYKSIETHSVKINGLKTSIQNHFHDASADSWCLLNSCNMKIYATAVLLSGQFLQFQSNYFSVQFSK